MLYLLAHSGFRLHGRHSGNLERLLSWKTVPCCFITQLPKYFLPSGNIILTWTPTIPTLNSFFLRTVFCTMLSTTLRESVSFVRTAGKLCAALSSVRTTTSNASKELSSGCVRALEAQSAMDCFPFLLHRHLPPLR